LWFGFADVENYSLGRFYRKLDFVNNFSSNQQQTFDDKQMNGTRILGEEEGCLLCCEWVDGDVKM
jgi:hypothetical protein